MYRRTKLLAAVTRAVAATLILSVAGAGVPAAAQEVRDRPSAAQSALRRSIDRAVDVSADRAANDQTHAALSAAERADVAMRSRRLRTDPVAGQAAGGGKGRIILGVLGLAASVWSTWYMIEWMKEQQERETAEFRP